MFCNMLQFKSTSIYLNHWIIVTLLYRYERTINSNMKKELCLNKQTFFFIQSLSQSRAYK